MSKPLTKKQRQIIANANARLKNILQLGDAGYYAPAVQKALERTNGVVGFTKDTLQAAKNFLQSKTSTVKGVKKWAAQNKYRYPQPEPKKRGLTVEERQLIDRSNKRLQYRREHGYDVPPKFRDVTRFKAEDLALAKQFDASVKTRIQPRRPLRMLNAQQGRIIKSVYTSLLSQYAKEIFYEEMQEAQSQVLSYTQSVQDIMERERPYFTVSISDIENVMKVNNRDEYINMGKAFEKLRRYYGSKGLNL